jgi:hypothetical protein
MLKVRFLQSSGNIEDNSKINHYADMSKSQFIDIFLPCNRDYTIVEEKDEADICICGTQHTDNSLLRKDELNIFYTIENFSVGRTHYQHFNKFGRYDNPMIQLYIYNDITIPRNNTIPAIYQRIKYFNKLNDINTKLYYENAREFYNKLDYPFSEKKFCLFISQNMLNPIKMVALKFLSQIGPIHSLKEIAKHNKELQNINCYNSYELLKLFNQYKFIICCENSNTAGYTTEKIFNVFLAKSIPIYNGDPEIDRFINRDSYISFDSNLVSKINLLNNNEYEYNKMINAYKTYKLDYTFIENNFDNLLKKKYLKKNNI